MWNVADVLPLPALTSTVSDATALSPRDTSKRILLSAPPPSTWRWPPPWADLSDLSTVVSNDRSEMRDEKTSRWMGLHGPHVSSVGPQSQPWKASLVSAATRASCSMHASPPAYPVVLRFPDGQPRVVAVPAAPLVGRGASRPASSPSGRRCRT